MKRSVLVGLLLFLSLYGTAQSGNPHDFQKMVDFLPPPPNAAAIIKHSALNINKNNGSPSFNIPIFTVKGNKLSAGISIGYSSTGLKVDEIASRAGMGWALNAGGVVTRTVRGVVDEWNTRITPYAEPISENCGSYNFMNNAASSLNCNGPGCAGWDAEPDLFNFTMNGISGSFVYDGSGNPVLIPAEKYKIQKDLGRTDWNFIITDNNGIEYYFGGTGAVEKTKRLNSCGKTYDDYITNSWYLVKMKHPNGEVIDFSYTPLTYTYDNGVTETQYWAYWMVDYDGQSTNPDPCFGVTCPTCPAAPPTTQCINTTSTVGVLLSSIVSGNDIVNFTYQSRLDCGDKLIDRIKHYNDAELLESVNFFYNEQVANTAYTNKTNTGHTYTPYLTDLQRMSGDNVFTNTHRFVYNDPAARPPRLSFSQDHWGYFNGKINTTFIPKNPDPLLINRFPNALANREPDPAFASKGMLTKIVYPTGGVDLIDYENNEVNDEITGPAKYQTQHEYVCNVTGTGTSTPVQVVQSTTFTIDKAQHVELTITCSTSDPGYYDPVHMKGSVEVTGTGGAVLYEFFLAGSPAIEYKRYLNPTWYLPAGTYTLTYGAKGAAQTTEVKMKFLPVATASTNANKIIGGVRVKRVITGNPDEKPTVKRYHYAHMDNLAQSSMSATRWPVYVKNYRNTLSCSQFCGPWVTPTQAYCDLTAMYSGSLVNLFNYSAGLISYASVIESIGENFEGGATQTKFYAGPNGAGSVIWGDDILDAPLSNFSDILNGKVLEEITFKKPAAGAMFPIKKSLYNYLIDSRQQTILYGYNVRKKYTIYVGVPGTGCPPANTTPPRTATAFDVVKYSIISYWTHPETVTETLYDENGLNPVTTVNNTFYDNDQHFQLTRSETVNSKGENLKTVNTYPADHTATTVYNDMTTKNILTPLVTSKTYNGINELSYSKISYSNVGSDNYVPVTVERSAKGNALEVEGTISQYDAHGNILEFTGKNGVVNAIIWGYDHQYPVAQVVGASYTSVVAQLTGGSVTALQSMDGSTLLTELNLVRTGIPAASVTTYTYKVMVGVTSITDPNNKTNTYEYDSFGRLVVIKDQDGNAIKKNEYVYAGSSAVSMPAVFFNTALNKNYLCLVCAPGYIDNTTYTYTVPAGKYYSLVSQAAADAQAAADTDGQEYANKQAKCVNYTAAACTGDQYKVINCICELGIKTCMGSAATTGGWLANFRYQWSDGSYGTTFTEFVPTCTGADKKFLNCICETGVKVCEDVDDLGGGSYQVTYHYQWSDLSTSAQIIETISCSGIDKKMIGCNCETAVKKYETSIFCSLSDMYGCCPRKWKCGFYYKWSDGSKLFDVDDELFYECADASCLPTEEEFMPIEP